MKGFTYAATEKGVISQFKRATKNKDEEWYWDNLEVGDRYEFLLKYYYNSRHPTAESENDHFYHFDFVELPEEIQDMIFDDWKLFFALWVIWQNKENAKRMRFF